MTIKRHEQNIIEAEESLAFWWNCHQEWINAPLGSERSEGLALCNERLMHFAKIIADNR